MNHYVGKVFSHMSEKNVFVLCVCFEFIHIIKEYSLHMFIQKSKRIKIKEGLKRKTLPGFLK